MKPKAKKKATKAMREAYDEILDIQDATNTLYNRKQLKESRLKKKTEKLNEAIVGFGLSLKRINQELEKVEADISDIDEEVDEASTKRIRLEQQFRMDFGVSYYDVDWKK